MDEPRSALLAGLELATLQAFIEIAEAGSFRAAAARLYTSQSSLSRTFARLERELNVTLFERTPKGVLLTPPGRRLLAGAIRILDATTEVLASIAENSETPLRLGASATAAASFLARFLSDWIPLYKNVSLQLVEGGAVALGNQLARRECDVAIVASPVPASCEHLPLTTCTIIAVFPPTHPFARDQSPMCVSALNEVPLLVNSPDFLSRRLLMNSCVQAGATPRIVYQSPAGRTLAALAEAGLGVAIVSDNVDLRGFDLPTRVLIDINGRPLTFDLNIAWWDRAKSSLARRFAHDLFRYFSEHPHPV